MECLVRYLPWSAGLGGHKVTAEELKLLGAKQRISPVMEVPATNKLKRKREDSGDPGSPRSGRSPNKKRMDKMPQVPQTIVSKMNGTLNADRDTSSMPRAESPVAKQVASNDLSGTQEPPTSRTDAQARAKSKSDLSKLRLVIDTELGLEILLKHDELRLIDQEIGKCQVALEQLRRCQEIPFPATTSNIKENQAVRDGQGLPLAYAGPSQVAISPAPWGVTDGPYTRHYARWLLPDPRFDGGEVEPLPYSAASAPTLVEGRSTRGSFGEVGAAGKSSRSHRGSTGGKLQALPAGYAQPKDKSGPLIMTRASDGLLVKLVCVNCRRDNFSSAQGFINHCRIAHGQVFASHEAAAQTCGEPVETDEAGAVIGIQNELTSTPATNLVHPYIRVAHTMGTDEKSVSLSRKIPGESSSTPMSTSPRPTPPGSPANDSPSNTPSKGRKRGRRPRGTTPVSTNFVPSPDTPFLSALMQKKGSGLDLEDIVLDAKTKVEIESSSSEDEDSEEQEPVIKDVREQGGLRIQGTRAPIGASMSPALLDRPSSRKGLDKANRKPRHLQSLAPRPTYQSPYPMNTVNRSTDVEMLNVSPTNLSPNTVESNQAPSLVSDDEYEAQSESESPSSAEADNDDRDVDVEVEDEEATTTTTTGGSETTSTNDNELGGVLKSHPDPGRRASALRGSIGRNRNEEKHVSFVSPDVSDAPTPPKAAGRRKNKG